MSNGAGKGSRYRPVNKKLYDENYDKIFGRKKDVGSDRSDESGLGKEETNNDLVLGKDNAGNS